LKNKKSPSPLHRSKSAIKKDSNIFDNKPDINSIVKHDKNPEIEKKHKLGEFRKKSVEPPSDSRETPRKVQVVKNSHKIHTYNESPSSNGAIDLTGQKVKTFENPKSARSHRSNGSKQDSVVSQRERDFNFSQINTLEVTQDKEHPDRTLVNKARMMKIEMLQKALDNDEEIDMDQYTTEAIADRLKNEKDDNILDSVW